MGTERFPVVDAAAIGWLTEAGMVEVDRVMIDDLGIDLVRMMENAGRNLARLVIERFAPARVTVLAGSGGNGGGGLVAARHLANRGVDVAVTTSRPETDLRGVPAEQLAALDAMERLGSSVVRHADPRAADVVIDALIGYSLKGAPRGRAAELIEWTAGATVVALDTPSGVMVTDGATPGVATTASATMTLALPKVGLRGHPLVGELYLADISVPGPVYDHLGIGPAPDFAAGSILRVSDADAAVGDGR